jgi:hypothetical protein
MGRLKIAATATALLGGLALTSAAHAFTFLEVDSGGTLLNFNSATGTTSAAGTQSAANTNVLEGLGQIGTTVYGDSSAGELYKITLSGGVITETALGGSGLTGVSFVDFGSTTGALYAIGNNGDLYTIGTNGAATLDGSLGLGSALSRTTGTGQHAITVLAMSSAGNTLLLDDAGTMYSINTSSGLATKLGTASGTPTEYGALMFVTAAESGSAATAGLYGGSNDDGAGSHTGLAKFTISGTTPTENFAAALVKQTSPNSSHQFQFLGMAPGFGFKVLPEPSEWALMLVGVGAVGGALRARRRKATAEA